MTEKGYQKKKSKLSCEELETSSGVEIATDLRDIASDDLMSTTIAKLYKKHVTSTDKVIHHAKQSKQKIPRKV